MDSSFLLSYPHLVCFTLKHILNVFLVRAHAGIEDRNLISCNFVFLYHYKYIRVNCATLDCSLQGVVIYMFGISSQNDFCKEERVSAGLFFCCLMLNGVRDKRPCVGQKESPG